MAPKRPTCRSREISLSDFVRSLNATLCLDQIAQLCAEQPNQTRSRLALAGAQHEHEFAGAKAAILYLYLYALEYSGASNAWPIWSHRLIHERLMAEPHLSHPLFVRNELIHHATAIAIEHRLLNVADFIDHCAEMYAWAVKSTLNISTNSAEFPGSTEPVDMSSDLR